MSIAGCSWIQVYLLLTGGVSNMYYLSKCGIMELLESLADMNLLEDGTMMIPFTYVLNMKWGKTCIRFLGWHNSNNHNSKNIFFPTHKTHSMHYNNQ